MSNFVAYFAFERTYVYGSTNSFCMGHVFLFAVIVMEKKRAHFHWQARYFYVRQIVQKMVGGIWLAETKGFLNLNHLMWFQDFDDAANIVHIFFHCCEAQLDRFLWEDNPV